jgi:protein required for attachment to host cells
VHVQSRQKGVDLETARAGHVKGSAPGPGGAAYEPRTNVRDREHERFAREVATALNDGVSRGECAGLILVASNPFLGHLKSHLSARASKALLATQSSDYTALTDAEIAQRLRAPAS